MIRLIRHILDICILIGLVAGALISVLALLGAFIPLLDVINHFQIIIALLGLFALAMSFVWPSTVSALKSYGRLIVIFILCCSALLLGPELWGRFSHRNADETLALNTGTQPLKLLSFNIYMGTWDRKALAGTIINADPDVAALQEFAPNRFKNQPDLKRVYPHQAKCQSWRVCTLTILSKHPLTDIKSYQLGSSDQNNPLHGKLLAATVHMPGAVPFRLYNVHLAWPLPLAEKLRQLDKLLEIIESDRKDTPLQVVSGDFNSTGWAFRVDQFARKAALMRRDRFVPTFPSPNSRIKRLSLPAFLSLDHILTSPNIEAGAVVRVRSPIGDHWPIRTTLYLPQK